MHLLESSPLLHLHIRPHPRFHYMPHSKSQMRHLTRCITLTHYDTLTSATYTSWSWPASLFSTFFGLPIAVPCEFKDRQPFHFPLSLSLHFTIIPWHWSKPTGTGRHPGGSLTSSHWERLCRLTLLFNPLLKLEIKWPIATSCGSEFHTLHSAKKCFYSSVRNLLPVSFVGYPRF